jgi:cell cycle arrest protein BUB3
MPRPHPPPPPLPALASVPVLCSDGKKLAIAVSYTWEQGERSHPADAIVIKDLADESVRSK